MFVKKKDRKDLSQFLCDQRLMRIGNQESGIGRSSRILEKEPEEQKIIIIHNDKRFFKAICACQQKILFPIL